MTHTIYLETRNRPAALERLLRVTRHRGFKIESLQMETADKPSVLNIWVTLKGARPIHTLAHQLKKLVDVNTVTVGEKQAMSVYNLSVG
ncbi:MAG: acetolactate synthase 2 small subunit [Deltaproteobacteria bacterium]|nr:acetolactate synthase 2 small subunit [Deltaproteobacteria bacterium]